MVNLYSTDSGNRNMDVSKTPKWGSKQRTQSKIVNYTITLNTLASFLMVLQLFYPEPVHALLIVTGPGEKRMQVGARMEAEVFDDELAEVNEGLTETEEEATGVGGEGCCWTLYVLAPGRPNEGFLPLLQKVECCRPILLCVPTKTLP